MPSLSSLVPDKDLDVALPEGSIRVRYRPAALTVGLLDAMREAGEAVRIADSLLEPCARLLLGWDLTDDDEQPYPTDADALKAMPAVILAHVLGAIAADQQPAALPPVFDRERPRALPKRARGA